MKVYCNLGLLLILFVFQYSARAQSSGYWLSKANIPNFQAKAPNQILNEFSFSINDSLYIGSKSSFQKYNRETNTYIPKQTLTGISSVIASFSINNMGYVLVRTLSGTSVMYEYDPIKNAWKEKQQFYGTNVSCAASFVINGKAYIVGGAVIENAYNISFYKSSTQIWEYNPIVNVFIKKTSPPIQDGFNLNVSTFNSTTAFTIGNLGYVLFSEDDFFQYDPIVDAWIRKTSPKNNAGSTINNCGSSTSRGNFKVFSFKENGYSIFTKYQCTSYFSGGPEFSENDPTAKFLKYTPSTDTWIVLNEGCKTGEQCSVSVGMQTFGSYTITNDYVYFTNSLGNLALWTNLDYVVESSKLNTTNNDCVNYGDGANLTMKFTAFGNFQPANKFRLLLSDKDGNFSNPTILNEVQTGTSIKFDGEFSFTLSKQFCDSLSNYKLKIQATLPYVDDQRAFLLKDSLKYNLNRKLSFSNNIICEGSFTVLAVDSTASSYKWFKNSIVQNGVSANKFSISQAGKYFCQFVSKQGCIQNSDTLDLLVYTKPSLPIVSNSTICQGSVVSPLSATASMGNTLRWYGTNATGGNYSTVAPVPSSAQIGTIKYYVSQVSPNGCESDRNIIDYNVLFKPSIPITTSISICQGSVVSPLVATASSGNSLRWYGTNATGGISSTAAPVPSSAQVGSIKYYVSQLNGNGCESDRNFIDYIVLARPDLPSTNNTSICQGSVGSPLVATASSGNSLRWYGTNATGGNFSTAAPIPSSAQIGSTKYYVSQISTNGCESDRNFIECIVLPKPTIPDVTNISVCQGSVAPQLTAIATSGNNLRWYGTNATGGIQNSSAPLLSTSLSGKSNFYVSQINSEGCESDRAVITYVVNEKPSVPITTNITICQNSIVPALAAAASTGNSLKWYGTSSSGGVFTSTAPIASSSQVGTSKYYVSQINTSGCESDRGVLDLVILPKPTIPIVSSISICQGSIVSPLTATATIGNNLRWYGTNASGGAYTSVAPTPSSAQVGTVKYYVSEVNSSGCESDRSVLDYIVLAKPSPPGVSDVSVCMGSIVPSLTAIVSNGNTLKWYGNNASGGTASSAAPVPSSAQVGTSNFYVSQMNSNNCESDRAKIQYLVNENPIKPVISWNGSELSTSNSYTSYQWILNNQNVSGATSNTHKPINVGAFRVKVSNASNCTDTSIVFNLVVTALNPDLMRDISIRVYPNPAFSSFFVDLGKIPLRPVSIQLLNYEGKLIRFWQIKEKNKELYIDAHIKGIFILVIDNVERKSIHRLSIN